MKIDNVQKYPCRFLLIGDTSTPESLGRKLHECAISLNLDITVSYTSPAPIFSPSMAHLPGKIFYRLADRRSWEWWSYQASLIQLIDDLRPELVLVTGICPLDQRVFNCVKTNNGKIFNWLTDDPWNPIHKRQSFLANLPHYDHIFSTKQSLQQRLLFAGVTSTSWLPFAYHPPLHYPPLPSDLGDKELFFSDISFVGTGARERLPWLAAARRAADINGATCRLYGASWDRINTPGWQRKNVVQGTQYCKALFHARIVLGLLRASNHDKSTDRSYEIGAIGACGLMQDSDEHRVLLPGYPDEGFFTTPENLTKQATILLQDDDLCMDLRRLGLNSMNSSVHTYKARLLSILEWCWEH